MAWEWTVHVLVPIVIRPHLHTARVPPVKKVIVWASDLKTYVTLWYENLSRLEIPDHCSLHEYKIVSKKK